MQATIALALHSMRSELMSVRERLSSDSAGREHKYVVQWIPAVVSPILVVGSDGTIQPKGHDTIQYDITQNMAIWYDTIRFKSALPYVRTACPAASCRSRALPIFTAPTRSFEVGHWPTSGAAPPDTVPVWVNVSVVTVNRTKTAVFC